MNSADDSFRKILGGTRIRDPLDVVLYKDICKTGLFIHKDNQRCQEYMVRERKPGRMMTGFRRTAGSSDFSNS